MIFTQWKRVIHWKFWKQFRIYQWVEFSVNASGNNLSVDKVLNEVLKGHERNENLAASEQL